MNTHKDDDRAERLRRAIRSKKTAAAGAAARSSRAPAIPPRPAEAPARLGELQRSLWLAHQLDPDSPAYHLVSAFRLSGAVDVARIARAFDAVVARHRILRSTYRASSDDGNDVWQIVHPPRASESEPSLRIVEAEEGAGLAVAAEEARAPFDLEAGPLVRLRLIEERESGERLLLLVLHHLLADERSLERLWEEMAEAYRGALEDTAEADAPAQYDDYVHWLRHEPHERAAELSDWRRRLDPMPDELQLAFERKTTHREDRVGAGPSGRLLRRAVRGRAEIRRLGAATGTTPFTVFAFAYRLLLQRYTEGRRVAFATPVSLRSHPATASMIGYFLNPAVVPILIEETLPVEEALRGFGRELRDILAHATLPFQNLAEELAVPRRRGRHPVFQTMFVYQKRSAPPALGEARLSPVALDLGASKFDLTVFTAEPERESESEGDLESEDSLEIAVEYRADRFETVWITQLLDHYETLLGELPRDRARLTAEVPMLNGRERRKIRDWSRGVERHGPGELLPRAIRERARRSPAAPAVIAGDARRTHGELAAEADAITLALTANGVSPGDRVGLFIDRSSFMIGAVVGVLARGAAYVPCDPGYPEARNRHVLEDADVAAVLTTRALHARLPAGPWSVIEVDGLDTGEGEAPPELALPESAAAYLLYTSGSTGMPKGVVVTHENLRASTAARRQAYDLAPERFLLVPSVAFDSSVAGIFWTLAEGGALVVPTDEEIRDPRRLADLVERERVSGVLLVPSLYARLLDVDPDRLKSFRMVIVAGESCASELVEAHFRALPGARLFNEYGPTEATVWATVAELTPEDAGRPVSIGRPIPGVRLQVLDGLGRPVSAGIPGSAFIAGPTVADGYWRRPDLTAERFDADRASNIRRYRTGDRMMWTADGRLSFLGREDDQIKLRGFRIEPGEVEAALLESADVECAAVIARDSQLVAFVEASASAPESGPSEDWRRALRGRLPDPMIPSRRVVLAALPRLPNGKVDRHLLRAMPLPAEARRDESRSEPIPSTREQAILSLWEGLLGREGIGLDDNFFELGGHSLLAVETVLAVERDLGTALSAAEVFASPTARALARRVAERGASVTPSYEHLFPIQPRGAKAPFIVAIPHFFTAMFSARFRGERPVYGLRGVGLRPEGNRGRWRTMTDLGEDLADEILRRFPDDGYILAGYSFGASMAVEAARVLEERGRRVNRLFLIAPMPVDIYRVGPVGLQIDGLREPVEALSLSRALGRYVRANHPLTRRPYRRAWRRLAIEPWRRLVCAVGRVRRWAGLPLTPGILHADVRVERFRLHSRWRPGVVSAPTVVFNAEGAETDAASTWRPYFAGPLLIHDVPDPHLGDDEAAAAREIILAHMSDVDA